MKITQVPLTASLIAAATITLLSSTSRAVTYYVEGSTDAGQTLGTAANAGAATGFSGTLSTDTDADLYMFTITNAGTYRFSDVNGTVDTTVGGSLDTQISLFSSTGTALATNDDANGTTFESAFTLSLAAGNYYFGITSSGNEAVNNVNQLLFNGYPAGDTTATRGAASGVNPSTLSTFNSQSYTTDRGAYNVTISAVPEPSTWAALALGSLAAGVTILRRRTA